MNHKWIERFGLKCCQYCGIVKNPNGNKPCPGKVRPELRDNRVAPDMTRPGDTIHET